MKHQDSEITFKDPVCGMEVSRPTAIEDCDYQGKTDTSVRGAAGRRSRQSPGSTVRIIASTGSGSGKRLGPGPTGRPV